METNQPTTPLVSDNYIEAAIPIEQNDFTPSEVRFRLRVIRDIYEPRYQELLAENARLKEKVNEFRLLAQNGLPNECVNECDEIKFCEHRNRYGNKCKQCSELYTIERSNG